VESTASGGIDTRWSGRADVSDVRTNPTGVERRVMGIVDKVIGADSGSTRDYVELDLEEFDTASADAAMNVHVAEVSDKRDTVDIKDAVYDGDMVIADITRLRTSDRTAEHIVDELRQVAHEVDGDIVQKGDDQLIVAPTGVGISRRKLGK
jgi:SepF-like predicted cell division protein (DUF552 family)